MPLVRLGSVASALGWGLEMQASGDLGSLLRQSCPAWSGKGPIVGIRTAPAGQKRLPARGFLTSSSSPPEEMIRVESARSLSGHGYVLLARGFVVATPQTRAERARFQRPLLLQPVVRVVGC